METHEEQATNPPLDNSQPVANQEILAIVDRLEQPDHLTHADYQEARRIAVKRSS